MNKKLQPTLLALSLAACFGTNATVYKIQNIDEVFKVDGTIDGSRSGFGVVANSAGKYIGGASGSFAITLTEEEERAITDSRLDVAFQQQADSSTTTLRAAKTKPIASNFVFDFDVNSESALVPRFIATLPELIDEAATATINSFVFGLNDEPVSTIAVGTTSSAAAAIADPDQSEGNSSRDDVFYGYEFAQRGMVIDNGNVLTFEPEFSTYGGQSGFTAINGNGTVVGYASVGIIPASQQLIDERCLESFTDTIPLSVCTGGFVHGSLSNVPTSYYLRAFSWQYADDQLTNRTLLGTLAEPINDDDATSYNSIALDVNDKGIAVGRSVAFRNNVQERSRKFDVAVVYKDGQIIDLMDHDNSNWFSSRALAINNNDMVIGSVTKNFSGFLRNKFFVYDVNDDAQSLVFPNDFKTTETDLATNANAINIDNLVVGNVEVDTARASTTRRTHGFIYDHNQASFQDLNTMMTCSSLGLVPDGAGKNKKFVVELQGGEGVTISYETDIIVVDANDIADDGTIMATALVKLPKIKTQWVNEAGEIRTTSAEGFTEQIVLDSQGRPVFAVDGGGQPITEQLPRAVVLKPSEEQACDLSGTEIVEEAHKREGANFGWLMLLLSFVGLGRRKFSN